MAVAPDFRGCPEHGLEDIATYLRKRDGILSYYCRVCRRLSPAYRARYPKGRGRIRSYGGPRCVNGHLKTPWTWKVEAGHNRCVTCRRERARRKAS